MTEGTRLEFWWRTVVTAVVLLGFGVAYFMIDANSRADTTAATVEADRLCEASAETRQFQIDIVTIWAQPSPVPPGATPELALTIERSNLRKQAMVDAAHQLGAPELCADGVPPLSHAGDYQLPPD